MIEGRDFAAAAMVGARRRQEDEWGVHLHPPAVESGAGLLAVLADGMGGAPAGDRASNIVVRTFLDSYPRCQEPARTRLRTALTAANDAIEEAIAANDALDGMGATLVAGLFFPDRCEWLSVGDSFIYLCRNGALSRVNPLHTYASELDARAARGEITREAALMHPDRPMLTSVVMGWPIEEVAQGELPLQRGDLVLLASDGLATLPDEEIAAICAQGTAWAQGEQAAGEQPEDEQSEGKQPEGERTQDERAEGEGKNAQRIADALLDRIEACKAPRQDNTTVIVVLPDGKAPKSPDKGRPDHCQRPLGARASGPHAGGTPALLSRTSPSCTQSLEKPLHGAPFNALQRFVKRDLRAK